MYLSHFKIKNAIYPRNIKSATGTFFIPLTKGQIVRKRDKKIIWSPSYIPNIKISRPNNLKSPALNFTNLEKIKYEPVTNKEAGMLEKISQCATKIEL